MIKRTFLQYISRLTLHLHSVVTLPRFRSHQDCKLGLDRPLLKFTIDRSGGPRELTIDVFGLPKYIQSLGF